MFGFGAPPHSSRKFIDLIFAASSKWANWDPPKQIRVGDFGTVDRKTGEFEKEGNIYDDVSTASLTANYPPLTASKDAVFEISSENVRRIEFGLEPTTSVPGIADASVKGQWQFATKRGALLVMHQPRSTYIPPKVMLKKLIDIHELKDKYVVTETFSCPAYSLYLSSGDSEAVSLALLATVPLPVAPVSVGGSIKSSWWSKNTSGLFRCACDDSENYCYTPLYTLKRIKKSGILRRDSPVPEHKDDDLWEDAPQPWDPLDSDGGEEDFEDTVFED